MGGSTIHPILSMLLTHTTSGPPVEKQATDLKIWLWAPWLKSDYFNSLTLWNVDELSWSWIPQKNIQLEKEKENFVVPCLRPLLNVKTGTYLHVIVAQWWERSVPKSVMHVQSCCQKLARFRGSCFNDARIRANVCPFKDFPGPL